MHVWIVHSLHHSRQSNDILWLSGNEVHGLLQSSQQCINMLVLDDGHIPWVHPKGISQPTESLLDIFQGLSGLIKQDTCPNLQRMSRILLEFIQSSVVMYLLDGPPEELDCYQ